ncbi:MerR family transcriptional regulator [Paracoccus aminophilus]|uniref:Transcriptional regulator, MerR family n=1 Tax=Paracoccus aminophilus JCM 7686 TaxID=1367847 RepID=S5XKJ3_PARAH|nr:MerR family DNA-binding transcriptional regulator [Paracoccus aminophilus]AGT07739.1 transcriptional regulator, MerR family [Paracoccus aminophilus JCM 7686]
MSEDLMTIREMSETFGVTPRALRFYEAGALISPLRKGQMRLYSRSDRARLKLILRGKRFGFSLDQIREILELYNPEDKNLAQTQTALATARDRLSDMENQQAELGQAILELRQQIVEGEASLARLKAGQAAPTSLEER